MNNTSPSKPVKKYFKLNGDWSVSAITDKFEKDGYKVLKNGWPDLMIIRNGRFKLIELKGPSDKLRPSQKRMHRELRKLGFKVETHYYDY